MLTYFFSNVTFTFAYFICEILSVPFMIDIWHFFSGKFSMVLLFCNLIQVNELFIVVGFVLCCLLSAW